MSEQRDDAGMIRASEIGEYLYCNRQWWLKRVEGVRAPVTERMSAGTKHHQEHMQLVKKATRNEKLIPVLVVAAVTLLALAILVAMSGA